jgi:segregation and condensation protein B
VRRVAEVSMEDEQKLVIEAMLFMSSRALAPDEIAKHMGIASVGSVIKMADRLVEEYGRSGTSLAIVKLAGKYSMTVKERYSARVSALAGVPDITKGGLRILAYISKNEPVMQNTVIKAFGDSAYVYIKELVEKEFITGRRVGRTKKIETTSKFKEYFSLS